MKRVIPVLAGLWGLFPFLSGAWAWQTNISGSATFSSDSARAVALDAAANVVAAGVTSNSGAGQDFTVIKFDGISGVERWRRVINGTANSSDGANAVTVDANGDVIAAGFTQNSGTGRDFTVVKFHGATGAELWRQVIDGGGPGPFIDEARTIMVDTAGDVVVGGFIRGIQAQAFVVSDLFVVKLNGASGGELWRQVIDSTASGAVNSVTVDAIGNVCVAGVIDSLRGRGGKFIVIKFDGASGAELWRELIMGSDGANGNNEAFAVSIDAQGSVFAAGTTANSDTLNDFTVIKFDGMSGLEQWRRVIDGTANSGDAAHAVTIDAAGNVIAGGSTLNVGSDGDFTVVKLRGTTGEVLWLEAIIGAGGFSGRANAVTVDGKGNVVAAGVIRNTDSSGGDFTVIKFDGTTGQALWRQLINGTFNDDDEAFAISVDSLGNAVAAGVTVNSGSGFGDFTVAKFDRASGAQLWLQQVNGPGIPSADRSLAVTIDARGNPIAAGLTENIGTAFDFTVVKFDRARGTELWRKDINGTANRDDFALAVAVDRHGNVVAVGRTENIGPSTDFTVVKLDSESGAGVWRQTIKSTEGFAEARAVKVDTAGDVVAIGDIRNTDTIDDFAVIKLDGTTGTELWRQIINGTDNSTDFATAVTVDAAGHVVAAGRTVNIGTDRDLTVVKLDRASGEVLWLQAVHGTGPSFNDQANAVTTDGTGNVVAAGVIQNIGSFGDFTVIKFDGASGQQLWQQSIRGTDSVFDEAHAVTVDSTGDVVAAGTTQNTGSGEDFTVVKFNGNTGAELWRQVINGTSNEDDQALAVALDRDGNVIAGGFVRNTGTGDDFTIVKLDRSTGAELWRRAIDGTENNDDAARAVMVDAAGNVVAAGSTRNTGTGEDFTVVKLRGSDGGDFIPSATLAVTPPVIRAGGTVTATWSGIATPTSTDWIGLYSPGTANTEFIDWIYVSCSKKPKISQSEGSCPLVVPADLKPGNYALRLFANDGFTVLATSSNFKIVRRVDKKIDASIR